MPEKEKKPKAPIAKRLVDNAKFLQQRIGVGTSFDLGVRKIYILNREVHIYYCNGLCDTQYIIELLKQIVRVNDDERQASQAWQIIENRLVHQQVSPVTSLDEAVDKLLSGLIIVLIEGESTGFAVDVRSYPGRQPQEPDTEKVVRGARDGYVENIIVNTALTRRRIRDERLRFEILQVGERSKTDVCIAYIKDVADPGLVELVKKELQQINVDGLTMGDKTVEEFLVKQGYNPYPLVRYTERPDVAATHLLEGHVLIMVDTSPSVIITPTTFFHHVQHAEEYRQSPGVGTFVRWVRFLGILTSLFLLPLWVLFVLEPELLPKEWAFIGPNKQTNIPIIVQILIADFGIELLRMAAIHTPTPLSTAMGLIAAVLIGQIAIDVGLFVSEVILYVSVASIGSFATPSYELSVANKISRLALVVLVALFKVPGFVIGATVYLLWLVSTRSLNTPYLWPFIPFDPAAFMQIVVRRSVAGAKVRPSIVHPQDVRKQPT
ncbi:Spore germination protein XA [Geobacillus stearothermophilus]|uniref:spore germination protein n=1 Tax=Geobacillus sp. DSP4a TaxID=2508873 RepID=UPI00067DEBE3|nr:spore germination protein [Geobacillus sp. DSP4a]AKU25642.1 stage V sporulation protein AF [Geobacillus sp. LC300]KZE96832.1 Spore germination protein XA [Geobacillus stearothermophilus]NNU99195.1 spore germination protein [Geobacillus sp. DSP4a]